MLNNTAKEIYDLPSLLPQDASFRLWTDWSHVHFVNNIFIFVSGEVTDKPAKTYTSIGITSQMASATAKNIKYLLVTTSDHGMSNQNFFMAACEEFDLHLTEHDIERPVVLLSDVVVLNLILTH